MLSDHFPRAARRYSALPLLGSLAADFHTWLLERGFRRGCRRLHLIALRRIDRRLRRRGRRQWSEVTQDDLEACWRRCRRGTADRWIVRNLVRFGEQRAGLPPRPPRRPSRVEALTGAYATMLDELRGLAPTTTHQHVVTATEFLNHIVFETQPARLARVAPKDIEAFVCQVGARLQRASLQHTVAHLRSFLRYLASRGAIRSGLDQQIDTPRVYRHEQLPRSLPWDRVRALLRTIDRATPQGLRDYTMFSLMATYGLRACEIVALTLDAIDWRRRVLRVPARKTGTSLLLPLTDAAGTLLVRYLRRGRPASPLRQLFLRQRAPAGVLKPTAVGEAFQKWVRRSGLPIPVQGPHCLRHSYAVRLLHRRIPLKTIGDLLGHRSVESTEVYLRLATADLRSVALSVPRWGAWSSTREGRR